MSQALQAREGHASVPGGELHYRLAGNGRAGPVLVFENGWSGSFPYAYWLEQALAPQARVLFYDRAGVADSRSTTAPTTAGMTRQLEALLDGLGITQPVVIVGHSYGGLIGALHAAQAPSRVKAIVQIDPTPEFEHELIDPQLRAVPVLARVLQACALLGLNDPLASQIKKDLPAEVVARLQRGRLPTVRSLNGAIAEIRLLPEIRGVVAASAEARNCPRLVISAGAQLQANWLQKFFGADKKQAAFQAAAHALHQRQAAQNGAGRWSSLPYGHVGLVTNRTAAAEISAGILQFLG